jgi:ribosomal protein L25 (general stress protein Ctc)
MLEAKLRDVRKKNRSLRNAGLVTGTLKRGNGLIIPISMISNKLETFVNRNGLGTEVIIELEKEVIKTKIDRVQRELLIHNIINIDLIEL